VSLKINPTTTILHCCFCKKHVGWLHLVGWIKI
jgi:hypothetical protein